MTANPVSQCAERFSFFTVAASKETNTPHLCQKDRCYLSSCTHCFLIPLNLSRYSTFKVNCVTYLYCTVATFRKLLIYFRHVGAPSYHCHHLDNFIPLYSSLISFRYLRFAVAIFTYFQPTVVTFWLFDSMVAQWLRCFATNRKVAGSIPAGVSGFFIDMKSIRSHYGPGVDSASNRNEYQEYFLGVKAAGA